MGPPKNSWTQLQVWTSIAFLMLSVGVVARMGWSFWPVFICLMIQVDCALLFVTLRQLPIHRAAGNFVIVVGDGVLLLVYAASLVLFLHWLIVHSISRT
jgi:type III secretory pathway component EscV